MSDDVVFGKATVGRFGSEMKTVGFKEGDRVSDLLSSASITLSTGEEVNDEYGNKVELNANAYDEQSYFIVKNLKNGKD